MYKKSIIFLVGVLSASLTFSANALMKQEVIKKEVVVTPTRMPDKVREDASQYYNRGVPQNKVIDKEQDYNSKNVYDKGKTPVNSGWAR